MKSFGKVIGVIGKVYSLLQIFVFIFFAEGFAKFQEILSPFNSCYPREITREYHS